MKNKSIVKWRCLSAIALGTSGLLAGDYVNFIIELPQNGDTPAYLDDLPDKGESKSSLPIFEMGSKYELWAVKEDGSESWLLDEKFIGAYGPKATLTLETLDDYEGFDANTGVLKRTRADLAFTVNYTISGLKPDSENPAARVVEFVHEYQAEGGELTEYARLEITVNGTTSNEQATVIPAIPASQAAGVEIFTIYAMPDCLLEEVVDDGKSNNGHGNNVDGVDSSNPGNSKEGEDTDPTVDDEIKKKLADDCVNGLCNHADNSCPEVYDCADIDDSEKMVLARVYLHVFPKPLGDLTILPEGSSNLSDATEPLGDGNTYGADYPNLVVELEELYPESVTEMRIVKAEDRASMTGEHEQDSQLETLEVVETFVNTSETELVSKEFDLTDWFDGIDEAGEWYVQIVHRSPFAENQDEVMVEYSFEVLPTVIFNGDLNIIAQ
ncbi:hypothetical protein [Persicirhabdus sediminis]|uniref:Uncharacterized protein n=1 Tax=Persicirhabdus sediminis TaxID=454144 RepID=A0A8J7MEX2_9BACT|nr:hypothetical protein [Persicirhabdus sediminis]MBK1790579.1 hypothetical protein [Persicirhabdus sediminis]